MRNNYHLDKLMMTLQDLEEIGGPDTLEDYIEILEKVKKEIEKRLDTAQSILKEEK